MGVRRQGAIHFTTATTKFISGYRWIEYWRYYSDIDRSISE